MTEKETIRVSKFLSLVLRHEPERVGLNHVPPEFIEFPAMEE